METQSICFTIPYPPTKKGKAVFCKRFGLNAYYSGKHWAARKKDADDIHALTLASLRRAKIRKELLSYPVKISFLWDDRLDVDNHAALAKAVVDALKGFILHDDDRRFFRCVEHGFWNGGSICVTIEKFEPTEQEADTA